MADEAKGGGGSLLADVGWIILTIIVLGFAWGMMGGPQAPEPAPTVAAPFARFGSYIPSPASALGGSARSSGGAVLPSAAINQAATGPTSPFFGQVLLTPGTGPGAWQPAAEYVLLQAPVTNPAPIAITGWMIANGRNQKTYVQGGKFVSGETKRVSIPQGAAVFSPGKTQSLAPIVLKPGDSAYLVTGAPPQRAPYSFSSSFKTNKCLGYAESADRFPLSPRLAYARSCPKPKDELVDVYQGEKCTTFIDALTPCREPEAKTIRVGTEKMDTINGQDVAEIPRLCREPALARLTYDYCLAHHLSDADFLGHTWYVYLGQTFELWDKSDETITLYDQSGRVVAQESY